jgi:hypothetical protein
MVQCPTMPEPTPATTHPRLFLTTEDVPRLRSWAVDSNPIWKDGLKALATKARQNMDAGTITKEDTGSAYSYTPYPVESYAELFAFLSLVDADDATRADDAKRARTLLMFAIDKASAGPAENQPFREPTFSTSNRSRWWGEGFALTVDWIYGTLSPDDKAQIRKVFLRWADENENADITTDNHPEPKGVRNDKSLTSDPTKLRWAGNNYFTAHMRNLGLMAMAFDPADDPNNELRNHLDNVTGAWLYMTDTLARSDLAGGLAAEGFEYGPQAVGYVVQLLLAIHTAGLDGTKSGAQSKIACNKYWDDTVTAYLHSLSPQAKPLPGIEYIGPLYSVAWYGDGDKFWAPDYIDAFGPLAVYDSLTKNAARLSKLRWIESNAAPGGAGKMGERVSANDFLIEPIFYFMMFEPGAPADPDPRPALPTSFYALGLGHMFARTDWTPNATWFAYNLGWSGIDHQHADGNQFQLYRNGEWLTKGRTGYGNQVGCTDYNNGVAIQNDAPSHNAPNDYTNIEYTRGSQWSYSTDGRGKIVAQTMNAKYTYALGDATALYQSSYEMATDVSHASRSIVWLPPDHVVVYDRAASKTENRFKRFWLNLPANGNVSGRVTSMTSPGGQKLFVSTLLPAAATISVEAAEPLDNEPADQDPIKFRVKVEANGGPTSTRFLNVLQAGDGGASAEAAALVSSTGGTPFEGAAVHGVLVLFPVDIATPFASVAYAPPSGTTAQLVTGLAPGAGYNVAMQGATITITPGGSTKADSGGVLVIGTLP